jgi:AcrR family transcriptional regulator
MPINEPTQSRPQTVVQPAAVPLLRATLPKWRSDLDPRAMPTTDNLTAGQRKVLQACLELFADNGFPATSIRDIAQAAGMQSASLYAHFASKDAILGAIVQIGYEHHVTTVVSAVQNAPANPRDQLFAAVHAHVLVHCEYSRLGVVIANEFRHVPEEMRAGLRNVVTARVGDMIIEILARGAEQGEFLPTGHHLILLAVASMGVDAARWYPYQTEFDAHQLAEYFASVALRRAAA